MLNRGALVDSSLKNRIFGFAAVLIMIVCATIARHLLQSVLGDKVPFITYIPVILVSTWIGGWPLGLAAAIVSGVVVDHSLLKPHQAFTANDRRAMPSLTVYSFVSMGVIAIGSAQRRARLHALQTSQQLLESYERERLVNQIGAAMRREAKVDDIQRIVVEALGNALQCDRCYYVNYDEDTDIGTILCDWMRPGLPTISGQYKMSDFFVDTAKAFRSGEISVIEDLNLERAGSNPPPNMHLLDHLGVRSIVRVPLSNSAVKSVLAAVMTDRSREWTQNEIQLIETVAAQTVSAVQTAQLQIREHNIAQQLQKALQPTIPEALGGLELAYHYRPALAEAGVGGDFVDVFDGPSGTTYLIMGDLSGKGLSAASQVAMIRHSVRTALHLTGSVEHAVRNVHQMIVTNSLLTGFATLFVACYHRDTRRIEFVNCGQDSGVVLRASNYSLVAMEANGPVLGGFEEAEFETTSVQLHAGDIVSIFTDGFTEAGPTRTTMLLQPGVEAIISECAGMKHASDVVAHVVSRVDAFAGTAIRDDQCFLAAIVQQ